MENTVINTEKKKNSLQSKTGIFSKFLATLKERVSLLFIILVFIHICIVMTQASNVLPIKLRALAGVIEFGLSAFLSYRFGYLGMLLSMITNGIAAFSMFVLSNEVAFVVANNRMDLPKNLDRVTKTTS